MDCNICLRKYNTEALTPRMLPSCGHTLCEECGVKLLANGQLACPFDRKVNKLESGSIKTLPKNFSILELLENAPPPNPAPTAPPSSRNDLNPKAGQEQSHNHNDDALDDDIDPMLLQEIFGPPSPGTPEPGDSEDHEIPVEEYLYNLQLADHEDPEQAADGPEEGRHVASDNDDALDDDIDPELLQEIFDPGAPPDAVSPGIPEPQVEDSEDDEISVEEYLYNLGLDENDDQFEDSDDALSSDDDEDPWMK